VSFAAITICVAYRVFVVVYFVIDSIQKLSDTPLYNSDEQTLPDSDHTKEHKTLQNVFQIQYALRMSPQLVPPNRLLVQELQVDPLFPVIKHMLKQNGLTPFPSQY
jgi:hypothetical protein